MADLDAATATQLRNIEKNTGRTAAQWAGVVNAAGLVKHGQIVAFLKEQHGLTHGNANLLAHQVRELSAGGPSTDDELLQAQYAGGKAALRPLYDALVAAAKLAGDEMTVVVQKTGVSLRRAKQFALIQAPSARRVQLGLNLKDVRPTARLQETTGMCSHRVDLTATGEVDAEITAWLRKAWEQAA